MRFSQFQRDHETELRWKLAELKKKIPKYTYEFLDSKANRNPNTAVAYARDLLVFFGYLTEYCPPVKDLDTSEIPEDILESLSFQDINDYQKYLSSKDVEFTSLANYQNDTKAIARKMSSLRGFFKYQTEHQLFHNDPTIGANKQRTDVDTIITRLTPTEIDTLTRIVESGSFGSERQRQANKHTKYRDIAIITLLLRTGIRVSECVTLNITDLNFEEHSMRVFRKGGKEQMLYFDLQTEEALLDYIDFERLIYTVSESEEALFLSSRKQRMAIRSIQEMLKKYAKVAIPNKRISPHKLRSTYGTALYNKTGDIRLVADVLGHNDINTTARHYAAMEDKHRRQAAEIDPYK